MLTKTNFVTIDVNDACTNPRFATGDFNSDGLMDIAFRLDPISGFSATKAANKIPVSFFTQTGDKKMVDSTAAIAGQQEGIGVVSRIISSDFNKDGKTDLAIAAPGQDPYIDGKPVFGGTLPGDNVKVFQSSPSSTYSQYSPNFKPAFLHDLDVADVNNDGLKDVFALSFGSSSYLMLNTAGNLIATSAGLSKNVTDPTSSNKTIEKNSDGSVKTSANYQFTEAVFVDANRDGSVDLLTMPSGMAPNGFLMFNDGKGDFSKSPAVEISSNIGYGPGSISHGKWGITGAVFLDGVTVDINNDGYDDVVSIASKVNQQESEFGYYQGVRCQVLVNNGKGFNDESSRILNFNHDSNLNYSHYDSITTFDLNADGFKDLVITRRTDFNYNPDGQFNTLFLINDKAGHFVEQTQEIRNAFSLENGTYIPFDANGKVGMLRTGVSYTGLNQQTGDKSYKLSAETLVFDIPMTYHANHTGEDIIASTGNDYIYGGRGNDTLNGNLGLDTAVFSGVAKDFKITRAGEITKIQDSAGNEGKDDLIGVERLRFDDKTIALDVDGNAGQVYRMYQAAFGRTPDAGGLKYWVNQVDSGVSLLQVADAFVHSQEFAGLYGHNPSATTLVDKLYQNVLHRNGDAGGLAYWNDAIGNHGVTFAQTLIGFSESVENKAALIGVIGNGIEMYN